MKTWVITAIVVLVGFGLGWQALIFGLTQTWWPLPISGGSEMVVTGTLIQNPVANPTGLTIQGSSKNYPVDLSRIKSAWLEKNINHQVTVRGQMVSYTPSDYLLVSWAK